MYAGLKKNVCIKDQIFHIHSINQYELILNVLVSYGGLSYILNYSDECLVDR